MERQCNYSANGRGKPLHTCSDFADKLDSIAVYDGSQIDRGHCAGNGRSQLRVNTRDGAGGRIAK